MKRKLRLAALAITGMLLLAVFTGCSGKTKTAAGKDKALPTVKIAMIVEVAVRPALVIAADKLGYYQEEGVNVEFVGVDSTTSGLIAVQTGKADIFPFSVAALSFIAQGSDMAFIAGTASEGSSLVVSRKWSDVNFRDFKNFKGKTIGITANNPVAYLTIQYIKDHNPEYTDEDYVTWLEFDDTNVCLEAINKGTVDGGMLATGHVWLAEERGLKEAFDLAEFLPEYLCCRQNTTLKTIAEKRDALKAVLRAQIRAENDYKNNTDKLVDAVTAWTQLKREHVVRYIAIEKNYYSTGLTKFRNPVSVNPMYNKIAEYFRIGTEMGLYKPEPGVVLKDHIDLSIYEDALNELIQRYPNDQTYQEMYKIFKTGSSDYWEGENNYGS